jgi:uncharacterized protein YbjT (DUF2867 family)
MFVITGATGNIGKVIANNLLDQGEKVKVVGRSAEKLQPFADKGAEVAVGSLDDINFVKSAYSGATAVFHMTPPDYTSNNHRAYQHNLGQVAMEAITASGVSHVLNLSSIGAHLGDGMGPVSGLYDVEQLLDETEANILHLRPVFFMENFYFSIPLIKSNNMIALTIKEDIALAMIATKDIGDIATNLLLAHDWEGIDAKELLGPKDYFFPEAASILGKAINKEINYVCVPPEQARQGMIASGISENVADLLLEMYESMNLGVLVPTEMRTPENSTPTTLEEFAKTFAFVYEQS